MPPSEEQCLINWHELYSSIRGRYPLLAQLLEASNNETVRRKASAIVRNWTPFLSDPPFLWAVLCSMNDLHGICLAFNFSEKCSRRDHRSRHYCCCCESTTHGVIEYELQAPLRAETKCRKWLELRHEFQLLMAEPFWLPGATTHVLTKLFRITLSTDEKGEVSVKRNFLNPPDYSAVGRDSNLPYCSPAHTSSPTKPQQTMERNDSSDVLSLATVSNKPIVDIVKDCVDYFRRRRYDAIFVGGDPTVKRDMKHELHTHPVNPNESTTSLLVWCSCPNCRVSEDGRHDVSHGYWWPSVRLDQAKHAAVKMFRKEDVLSNKDIEDADIERLFNKEVTVHGHLSVVYASDYNVTDENSSAPFHFVATEYLRYGSLAHFLRDRDADQPLEERTRQQLARSIVRQMNRIHSKNIAHGDVKPQNILVESTTHNDEEQFDVRFIDFEFASLPKKNTSSTTTINGYTANWCSPQQKYSSKTSKIDDMWSLGLVLYEVYHHQCSTAGDENDTGEFPVFFRDLFPDDDASSRRAAMDGLFSALSRAEKKPSVTNEDLVDGGVRIPDKCNPLFAPLLKKLLAVQKPHRPTIHELSIEPCFMDPLDVGFGLMKIVQDHAEVMSELSAAAKHQYLQNVSAETIEKANADRRRNFDDMRANRQLSEKARCMLIGTSDILTAADAARIIRNMVAHRATPLPLLFETFPAFFVVLFDVLNKKNLAITTEGEVTSRASLVSEMQNVIPDVIDPEPTQTNASLDISNTPQVPTSSQSAVNNVIATPSASSSPVQDSNARRCNTFEKHGSCSYTPCRFSHDHCKPHTSSWVRQLNGDYTPVLRGDIPNIYKPTKGREVLKEKREGSVLVCPYRVCSQGSNCHFLHQK